jgi:DNA damage-binding protein 1
VTTDKLKFAVLEYDAVHSTIVTRANGDVRDSVGRQADVGQLATIDPDCRLIGLHMYDGVFKVMPLDSRGNLSEAYNIRLEEQNVLDLKFLHGAAPSKPVLAILYQDSKGSRHVKTYEVNLKEKEFQEGPWTLPNVESGASLLIPLPQPFGGVIVIGEHSIMYHNGAHPRSIAMKTAIMRAYGKIDANGSRILLGDHTGKLYILLIQHDGAVVVDMKLELLAETTAASSINYLDNGVVFIGSTYGDSQLVRLLPDKDPETGQFVSLLDVYPNLGPIVDFAVVDVDKQGQGQIVSCSGAYKDGSIRIVRAGIGINEFANVELDGMKGVWSFSASPQSGIDKYLVISHVDSSRVLAMSGSDMNEVTMDAVNPSQPVLFCSELPNFHAIIATADSVKIVNVDTGAVAAAWAPPSGSITQCAANTTQLLVATGNILFLFGIENYNLSPVASRPMENEVACINIHPLGDSQTASVAAVGLWTDISLRLLQLPSLNQIVNEGLGGEIIPRSALLTTLDGIDYLLVGMGDGHLFHWTIDTVRVSSLKDPLCVPLTFFFQSSGSLMNRRKLSLGTHPIMLSPFMYKDQRNVFACSDRPTVIYPSNKKLLYSTVNLKAVNAMTPFDTPGFPDGLALATDTSLVIGSMEQIQKLHIRTIPLNEMPRRIAYQESSKTYCATTVRYDVDDAGEEVETNFVRLFDDQTFETLDTYKLQAYESGCSIVSMSFPESNNAVFYVVGTAFALPTEEEPTRGRIIVFAAGEQRLQVIAEVDTRGAVYSMESFNGKVLAGINSRVALYKLVDQGNLCELKLECDHGGHILVLYLATRGDFILVGDLMKSVSLLVYKPSVGRIEEISRDYQPNWMTAVSILDADTFLGAENSFNIFTVKKFGDAATDEERLRLEPVGAFHVGDLVNRFRQGSLIMKLPDAETPTLQTTLYCTVYGAIGVIASLPEEAFRFFWSLQECMSKVKGVGGFMHAEYRAFQSERKTEASKHFVDGDLIEQFLDWSVDKQTEIAVTMNVSVEAIVSKIEAISQALH